MKARRLAALAAALIIALTAMAQQAVTLVKYSQESSEWDGTMSLKNNTDEDIHSVKFRLVYTDMDGNQLDYADFAKKVDIAPGMTKQIEVEAYNRMHDACYYLNRMYRTEDAYLFKVKFRLMAYNGNTVNCQEQAETEAEAEAKTKAEQPHTLMDKLDIDTALPSDVFSMVTLLLGITVFILVVYFVSVLLVAYMARNRHRNVVAWVLVSVLVTPLVAIAALLVLGNDDEYVEGKPSDGYTN